MKLIFKTICAASIAASGLFTSCADYLDVSKELSQNLDKEEVFSTAKYLTQWYGEMYQTCPNYSETGLDVQSSNGTVNAQAIYSGELVCAHPNVLKFGQNTFTPSSTTHNRWWNCYKQIRQGMIFLEEAPESLGDPANSAGYISVSEMRRYKADVIYLIAYNYFLLFELYGPTPIVTEVANPEDENIDYARASVDEMVQHIDGLLARLIDGDYSDALPETIRVGSNPDTDHNNSDYNLREILRPTKAAALALRARLWVYAASPLYNGGYAEALALTNKDGKRLFPDYDASKWQTAKERLEDLLTFADAHGMKLYKAASGDPNESIYELFQYYNDEILWANGNNDYNDGVTAKMESRTIPGGISGGMGNVGFYQNIIDLFFTENGLDIDEDPAYNEEGFTDYPNRCNEDNHVDKHIFNMYVGREPRFYADVTYEGKSWHIQRNNYDDWGTYLQSAGDSKGTSGASYRDNTMHARTGYLLYKFNNRTLINDGSNPKDWGRPWIYFRLGDFYLYYAECCMETGDLTTAIKYVDMIRERAGIPGYQQLGKIGLWAGGNGDVSDLSNKEAVREAIYRERIIEMLAEGNYYFDMHRWMRAGWTQTERGKWNIRDNETKQIPRYGMDINEPSVLTFDANGYEAVTFNDAIGEGSFYNRIVKDQYPWSKAMLLYPVPYNEMQKSQLLVQNPLWN